MRSEQAASMAARKGKCMRFYVALQLYRPTESAGGLWESNKEKLYLLTLGDNDARQPDEVKWLQAFL